MRHFFKIDMREKKNLESDYRDAHSLVHASKNEQSFQ